MSNEQRPTADPGGLKHPVLDLAREEAVRLGHPYVGTEHLLLALLRLGDAEVQKVLEEAGTTPEAVKAALEETLPREHWGKIDPSSLPYTSRTKKVIAYTVARAREPGIAAAEGRDFLQAIFQEQKNIAAVVLSRQGVVAPVEYGL